MHCWTQNLSILVWPLPGNSKRQDVITFYDRGSQNRLSLVTPILRGGIPRFDRYLNTRCCFRSGFRNCNPKVKWSNFDLRTFFRWVPKKNTNQPTNQPTCKTWGWTNLLCKKTHCCVCWTKCSVGKIRRRKRLYIVHCKIWFEQASNFFNAEGVGVGRLAALWGSGGGGAAPFCLFVSVFCVRVCFPFKKTQERPKKNIKKKNAPQKLPQIVPPPKKIIPA